MSGDSIAAGAMASAAAAMPNRVMPTVPKGGSPEDMAKTAKEFEAVFIGQMVKIMMEGVEQSPEFSGGGGEQMFRGIMAEKLGNAISDRGGIGLAPSVLQQMIRMQDDSQ